MADGDGINRREVWKMVNQPLLREKFIRILEDYRRREDKENPPDGVHPKAPRAIVWIRDPKPIKQEGPQCGIVALSMAADILHPKPENSAVITPPFIYEEALSMDITYNGEIFSVHWMEKLASVIYPLHKAQTMEIARLPTGPRAFFVESLIAGKCILVPYDTDRNFGPCQNNGRNAHWALIVGFMVVDLCDTLHITSIEDAYCGDCFCLDMDQEYHRLYWAPSWEPFGECPMSCCLVDMLEKIANPNIVVYLLAIQGKSKHVAVWPLEKLLESNANLWQFGEKRANDGRMYKIPEEGVAGGLRGKVLVLGNDFDIRQSR